ncbi:hypothetical protein BS78_03G350100 [Paspalum vaginatum]|nr:hypothetical protein BS78_03G350100 [Paspalum vaginatum]
MATVRALSAALLLAICFAACACALAAERMPKNRYISYAPEPRGKNGAGGSGNRIGCSVITRCGKGPAPTKGDYMSHAALPTDKHPALEKASAKKMGVLGSKSPYIYISHAAMYRD